MLKVPSQISKIMTLADGGLRLQIDTAEIMPEDKAELMALHNKQGWFVFSDTGITEADIPKEEVDFSSDKTPAQRQRAIIYRLWEQSTITTRGEFETFYRNKVNAINEKLKEKLQ